MAKKKRKSIRNLNVHHRIFTRNDEDFINWAKRQEITENDAELKKYLKEKREDLGIKTHHILPKRKQYAKTTPKTS